MDSVSEMSWMKKWGLCLWSPEHDAQFGSTRLHPEDRSKWNETHPYGAVLECIGVEDEYLIVGNKLLSFRLKPSLFSEVAKPRCVIGERVNVQSKGMMKAAIVLDIRWHHQRNEAYFFLEVEGKRSAKQYWANDIL